MPTLVLLALLGQAAPAVPPPPGGSGDRPSIDPAANMICRLEAISDDPDPVPLAQPRPARPAATAVGARRPRVGR